MNRICNINGVPRIKYTKASTILSSTVNLDKRTNASKIPPGIDNTHTIQKSDTVTFNPSAMVGIICNKYSNMEYSFKTRLEKRHLASSLVYISFFNYLLYILTIVLLVYHELYYLASLLSKSALEPNHFSTILSAVPSFFISAKIPLILSRNAVSSLRKPTAKLSAP